MKYALLSVSDKRGLVPFAEGIVSLGYTVLSTGGTAKALAAAGIPVVKVSDHTGAPEIMDGRVKTLHPRIHGGILGDRERHQADADRAGVAWIDVVVVNLYPFEAAVADAAVAPTVAEAIERIDVGGPTMVRAAAKNHAFVTVVVDPDDYDRVLAALARGDDDGAASLRRDLAVRAFRHTARYDAIIAGWLADRSTAEALPSELALPLRRVSTCRYGENPHQSAAFYADGSAGRSLGRLVQLQGKELSYNNIADADAAIRAVFELDRPACCVVKHANPCGLATADTLDEAYRQALASDPVSAYGGILAFNRRVTLADVVAIRRSKVFFEVIAAPGFDDDAAARMADREQLRLVALPADWAASRAAGFDAKRVQGGWLLQSWDAGAAPGWKVVTERAPTDGEAAALRFAWTAVAAVKSNAIALAVAHGAGHRLAGIGAGQTSRVDAVRLAIGKATAPLAEAALASDAFFPFADGLKAAAEAGVRAVIQPGGSIRDDEVVQAANEAGVAMVFTGIRHFRH